MRCWWIVCCLALSGCVAYRPEPLDAAAMAARFDARSLADPALRAYIERESGRAQPLWPVPRWDRHMLTLAAGFYSPALVAARAQAQAAQGAVRTAAARPNPTLEFPFEYELNHQGEGKPYTTGPALAWTVETGGKRAARIGQAQALAAAAQWNTIEAAWQVRSQVRGALLALFAQTRRSALLLEKLGFQQRSVDLLERRLRVGTIAMPELRRARLQLAQAQSDLAAARLAQVDARTRLGAAIGIPVAALEGVQIDFSEFEHAFAVPAPAQARRSAILHRADLHGALAEYEAGQAALRQEIARQYPDVQLGAGYSYDVGANKISFGLGGVTLPVFDRNAGAIAQAEAKRTELAARAQALQASIFNELDNALARYRAGTGELARAALQAALAARQRDSVDASLAMGASDRLEQILARVDAQSVKLDELNAVVALQQAAGQLEDAMQQGLPPASLPVNPNPSAP